VFLDEYAPLHREADFLLREELREVTLYYGILTAIAAGHSTVQEIARQAGQDPRGLAYYLQQLIELGYIERRYPLTGEPPSARSVRYDLADPLLRFWFRFVFPSTSYIRHMGADRPARPDPSPPGRLFRPRLRAPLPGSPPPPLPPGRPDRRLRDRGVLVQDRPD
jgi:AAA+ ATPase superfamily predicted ATPase